MVFISRWIWLHKGCICCCCWSKEEDLKLLKRTFYSFVVVSEPHERDRHCRRPSNQSLYWAISLESSRCIWRKRVDPPPAPDDPKLHTDGKWGAPYEKATFRLTLLLQLLALLAGKFAWRLKKQTNNQNHNRLPPVIYAWWRKKPNREKRWVEALRMLHWWPHIWL